MNLPKFSQRDEFKPPSIVYEYASSCCHHHKVVGQKLLLKSREVDLSELSNCGMHLVTYLSGLVVVGSLKGLSQSLEYTLKRLLFLVI